MSESLLKRVVQEMGRHWVEHSDQSESVKKLTKEDLLRPIHLYLVEDTQFPTKYDNLFNFIQTRYMYELSSISESDFSSESSAAIQKNYNSVLKKYATTLDEDTLISIFDNYSVLPLLKYDSVLSKVDPKKFAELIQFKLKHLTEHEIPLSCRLIYFNKILKSLWYISIQSAKRAELTAALLEHVKQQDPELIRELKEPDPKEGNTLLHRFVQELDTFSSHLCYSFQKADILKVVNSILNLCNDDAERTAYLEAGNHDGKTALHYAAASRHPSAALTEVLLEVYPNEDKSVILNKTCRSRRTPFTRC